MTTYDGPRAAHRTRRPALAAGLGALLCLASLSAAPSAAARTGTVPSRTAHPGAARPVAPRPTTAAEARTAAYLASIRNEPRLLRGFFRHLPKGGDLHNHLSGAVRTEYLIELAGEDGLCVDTATLTAVVPPCGPGARPAADARTDRAFHDAIVRAWSMQDFPAGQSGHDHFFDTFNKFGEVPWRHRGKLLAQVADSAAAQNQFYLETMVTPASDGARQLAAEVGWDPDLAALHAKLVAGGRLDKVVADARKEADDGDAEFRTAARCGTSRPRPGCALTVRWISQVNRGSSPERVFTQLALGMRLAERDSRFVAVNLVQPEDWDSSLAGYSLQMRMVQYLRTVYPKAHVTLHAGELTPGLVKPEDLAFHIAQAVDIAGADRIGHGVDLVHEDHWQQTARTMADRQTAVEVPFTSNAQILGVRGADHPFDTYRAHGVPVVLATDDPGVSRTDISHEYQYAAQTYGLTYPELKDLARASLQYAFLPGPGLWSGNPTRDGYRPAAACAGQLPGSGHAPGTACRHLLATSPKAAVQWRQEAAGAAFEKLFA
ncbi:adenosine deaminase family protein [Streptomyces arenae]|uniref:adenosine deaminase family protein n=1 Tax=Streptomyces arenae TaxID=29301 RepID=UPI002657E464|nr:adenosine deaminase [Streptomyces arenae]MCG7208258.1 adenosine deaminase [Streptomyces arenae]